MTTCPPEDERAKAVASSKNLVPVKANGGANGEVPDRKRRNPLVSFRELTDQLDEHVKKFEQLCAVYHKRSRSIVWHHYGSQPFADDVDDARDLWTETREGAEQRAAALREHGQWSMLADIHHPPFDYYKLRIGQMVTKFPDWKFADDDAAVEWANGLAERLEAEDLSVMVLESVFREIEDTTTKKSPIVIADVLPLLKKHKNKWQQRLIAIDPDQIQQGGEETVFAFEFKHAVFNEALLEYLDAHGYTELADGVRENELVPWYVAIRAAAMSEGLSESVTRMEACPTSEVFNEVRSNLTNKRHLMLEWELLLINAQRRLNCGKSLACRKCGAGYDNTMRCRVCENGGDVVGINLWKEHAARERQPLEAELEQGQLRVQYERQRRKKLECQRREQFVEARSAMRIARGRQRAEKWRQHEEEAEWAGIARGWEIEEWLWGKMERALDEHWKTIADEYDPLLHVSAETIDLIQRGVIPHQLTDEEFAELKEKARLELAALKEKERLALIERAKIEDAHWTDPTSSLPSCAADRDNYFADIGADDVPPISDRAAKKLDAPFGCIVARNVARALERMTA